MNDIDYMKAAYLEAQKNMRGEDYPVGAVLVIGDEIISRACNTTHADFDPTAHAEINVIRSTCERLKNHTLEHATLYTTLYPCPMCEAAMVEARIGRVVFGSEPFPWIREVKYKQGKRVLDGPVLGQACRELFVAKLIQKGRADILAYGKA